MTRAAYFGGSTMTLIIVVLLYFIEGAQGRNTLVALGSFLGITVVLWCVGAAVSMAEDA